MKALPANSAAIAAVVIVVSEVLASLADVLQLRSWFDDREDGESNFSAGAVADRQRIYHDQRRKPGSDRRCPPSNVARQKGEPGRRERRQFRGRRAADWRDLQMPLFQ